MDTDEIRLSEQLVLRYKQRSRCRRAFGGEVLAPGDDGHAEGFADLRDSASNVAEAEQSQCPSTEIIADEALPSTASQRCILVHEMTRAGQYESPSQLDGWSRAVAGMNYLNATFFCCSEIDRSIPRCRRGD